LRNLVYNIDRMETLLANKQVKHAHEAAKWRIGKVTSRGGSEYNHLSRHQLTQAI
jgi:hypothetical protein